MEKLSADSQTIHCSALRNTIQNYPGPKRNISNETMPSNFESILTKTIAQHIINETAMEVQLGYRAPHDYSVVTILDKK